ncbi:hypothetical protein GCM10027290_52070 [Micromonospora sonneratiae]|uniref:Uncharacterized protein n=1 Tax=Micromonospora sonneratiae TaxID=1184706 RepID=A0ABW3YAH3_9ACTN
MALRYLAVLVGRADYQGADLLVRRVLATLSPAQRADERTLQLALEQGRACPDPAARVVAETTPG